MCSVTLAVARPYSSFQFFYVLFLAEKLTRCQQHLHQLTGYSSLPPSGAFVPKCRSDDGHYKPLQCDRSSSVCFCVDDYDGYVLAGSTGVRQAAECTKFGMSTYNYIILFSTSLVIHIVLVLPRRKRGDSTSFWRAFATGSLYETF